MTPLLRVVPIDDFRLQVVDAPWPFAVENAQAIAAHWQRRLNENPGFFNGPIHLLASHDVTDSCLAGALIRTDFASYLYWRDHQFPDRSVIDCFGSALLRSRDGKVILGRQAPGHVNSGLTYPPGGFIDHRDVDTHGLIDVGASVRREAREELGYGEDMFRARQGALLTFDGPLLSIAVDHVSHLDADVLVTAARRFIAAEPDPEIEDVIAIGARSELEGIPMPVFARALLEHILP